MRLDLGQLSGERTLQEIKLPAPPRADRIQFRLRGKSLSGHAIVCADVTSSVAQLQLPVSRLDTQGEIEGEWFEPGRRYYVDLYGRKLPESGKSGCFVYQGQRVLEISSDLERL